MRKLLITLIVIGLGVVGFGQNTYRFFKTYDIGGGNDRAYSIIQSKDGNYVLYGSCDSSTFGDKDLFLIKVDTIGNVLWGKNYGGSGNDNYLSVKRNMIETLDGGYIMGNTTNSLGAGDNDFFIVKTDENGVLEWSKTYGDTTEDNFRWIEQTPDSGFIVVGETRILGGDMKIVIMKINQDGNIQWIKDYGLTYDVRAINVVTFNGGYLVLGDYQGYPCMENLDINGSVIWSKQYKGTSPSDPFLVRVVNSGIICLSWNNATNKTVVTKTNNNGAVQWSKILSIGNSNGLRSLTENPDGSFNLTGYITLPTSSEIVVLNMDSNGSVQWVKKYNNPAHNNAISESHIICYDGDILVSGSGSDFFVSDEELYLLKLGSNGELDCNSSNVSFSDSNFSVVDTNVTVTVNTSTFIESTNGSYDSISVSDSTFCIDTVIDNLGQKLNGKFQPIIYPNPANTKVKIALPKLNDNIELSVYSTEGRLILQEKRNASGELREIEWDISSLPNGTYLIEIKSSNLIYSQQLIKE